MPYVKKLLGTDTLAAVEDGGLLQQLPESSGSSERAPYHGTKTHWSCAELLGRHCRKQRKVWSLRLQSVWQTSSFILSLSSPWYNRTGWLGVKHQLTYSLSRCLSIFYCLGEFFCYFISQIFSFKLMQPCTERSTPGFLFVCLFSVFVRSDS